MMNDPRASGQPVGREGLCPHCGNVRVINNERGSQFYLCRLSTVDARYPKYPPQPVIACEGYRPASEQPG